MNEHPILSHSARLAAGYGALLYLVRQGLLAMQRKQTGRDFEEVTALANAQHPVVSLDPDTKDTEEEARLRSTGVPRFAALPELGKTASWEKVRTALHDWFDPAAFLRNDAGEYVKSPLDLITRLQAMDYDPRHLAAAGAATVGGGALGWQLADLQDRLRRREELRKRIEQSRNEIDKLLYDEWKGLYENLPTEKKAELAKEAGNESNGVSVLDPILNVFRYPMGTVKGLGGTAWWLYALASTYAAHQATKSYMDSRDPNRKRMKELKEVADRKARLNAAPVLFTDDPALAGMRDGGVKRLPEQTGTAVSVDPRDRTGQALMQI